MPNRAFIRFNNLTIPNYSELFNVYVRFTAYSDKSDTPVNLRCAFVDEDDPDAPTSEAELQAFSLTDWVSWSSLEGWVDGTEYDTPDLTDILQSIIERAGWGSNNSVILIIEDSSSDGQRGFSSIQFDNGDEKPILFVTYFARESDIFLNFDPISFSDSFGISYSGAPNPEYWDHHGVDVCSINESTGALVWEHRDSPSVYLGIVFNKKELYTDGAIDVSVSFYGNSYLSILFGVDYSGQNNTSINMYTNYLQVVTNTVYVGYGGTVVSDITSIQGNHTMRIVITEDGYCEYYIDSNLIHSYYYPNFNPPYTYNPYFTCATGPYSATWLSLYDFTINTNGLYTL